MHNVRNHLCSFPGLELPITVDDIFTEEDFDLIYDREKFNQKIKPLTNDGTFGTGADTNETLFGWSYAQTENLQWMYSPQEHKIPGSGRYTQTGEDIVLDKDQDNIEANINGDKITTFRPPTSIGILTNKKLMYTLKEYAQDTFHDDYLADIWNVAGRKIVPITVIGFSGPSTYHTEGLAGFKKVADKEFINNVADMSARATAVINFRMLGDPDDCSIEVADPDEEFTLEYDNLNKKYIEEWKATGKEPANMVSENGISVSATIDQVSHEKMLNHLTPAGKIEGYHSPFLLNLSSFHKVNIKSVAPRVSLRFMGHKHRTFEDFQRLIDEGKFLK